jgi:hypothetical protein
MILGSVWAAGLLIAGLFLLSLVSRSAGGLLSTLSDDLPFLKHAAAWLALAAICAAQFVFMVLVADVLCPGASMVVTGFLKTFFVSLLLLAVVRVLWMVIQLFGMETALRHKRESLQIT